MLPWEKVRRIGIAVGEMKSVALDSGEKLLPLLPKVVVTAATN